MHKRTDSRQFFLNLNPNVNIIILYILITMHYEALLLTNSQQLTTICVLMSSCQIVHGQFGFTDMMSNMFWLGPQRPPPNYHYESRGFIERTYPRNSYRLMNYWEAKARGLLAQQNKGNKKKKAPAGRGGGSGKNGGGGGDDRDGGGGGDDGDDGGDPVVDDSEPEGGGNPRGNGDDGDNDIPIEKPHNDRRKRGFSAPPDVARVDGSDAMAVLLVAAVPPDDGDDASGTDSTVASPPSTAAFSRKSESVLNKSANISYRRALKNIFKNLIGASTDFNSSQLDNKDHVNKDFSRVTENDSKINNNIVNGENNDFKENKVDECAADDDKRVGDKNIFDADNSSGFGYNEDEDNKNDKDNTIDDGYIDEGRNFIGYKSDHDYLENDDKAMLTDTDEIRLKTFLKLTNQIQSLFITITSGTKLVYYVNILKMILKELVIDIQKFFNSLVYTIMKLDRSVAEENIRKFIATTVNTMVLFIANALDYVI